jgi:predicted nucleic acid-binding Zn ribbon protein
MNHLKCKNKLGFTSITKKICSKRVYPGHYTHQITVINDMQNKRHKKPFQFNKTQNTNETKQTKKLSQQRPLTKRQTSPYTVAKSLKLCRQKLSKKKWKKGDPPLLS